MIATDEVKALLNTHAFTQALVIDDGFDKKPNFSELIDGVGAGAADRIDDLDPALKQQLAGVLVSNDLAEDEWEEGLRNEGFLEQLWGMHKRKQLPDELDRAVFGEYLTSLTQKKDDLKPLLAFLKDDLSLTVKKGGRDQFTLPTGTKVVFLDLFLGLNDFDEARELAASRIKSMLRGVKDEDRPIVVLMSTRTAELDKWAEDLRERAGLMGAKFRVIGKPEFSRKEAIAEVLKELLAPLEDANTVARLIDTWDGAIAKVNEQILNNLRRLDLSDYGYLKRYRLDAEGMPLGEYLLEAYADVLKYELEACTELLDISGQVDKLTFDQSTYPHFLPTAGVSFLNHAMTFVHEKAIEGMGVQMDGAASKLQLGDIIVDGRLADNLTAKNSKVESIPIHVVISPACDLQQGKADGVLLLSGKMFPRRWDEAFNISDDRIDCFRWKEREYSIDWQKANLSVWDKSLATRRLKKGGTHRRIGRLRALQALQAQNLFASNLTRVGTLAAPHAVSAVGLIVQYKDKAGARKTLFETTADEAMACLLKGFVPQDDKPKASDYLVFNKAFTKRLGEELKKVADDLPDAVRADASEFCDSPVAMAPLRQPCQCKKLVEHKRFKIEFHKKVPATITQPLLISAVPPAAKS